MIINVILCIVLVAIIVIVIYMIATYNSLKTLTNKVKEAYSTMDVYLKKRYDLIPNLVEIVKGYAKHESETLENIVKERGYDNLSDNEKLKLNENITGEINKLLLIAESYPELRASENFRNLSENLVKVEDDIASSRKYYNAIIRIYNNKVEMFPSNIFAKLFGYKEKSMFEASDDERKKVSVSLNEKDK